MEEKKSLAFGKKYRVGNFFVFKYNRVLRKSEVAVLRNQMGIPMDMRKNLQRSQLPYIKVEAVSGIWAVEFCCNTSVFNMVDSMLAEGGEDNEATLAHVFNMWFLDTTVPGDKEYQEAKAAAVKGYMDRCKANNISEEDDQKILDEMQADEEQKATIVDMANNLKN